MGAEEPMPPCSLPLLAFARKRHAAFRAEWSWMECSGMLGDLGTLLPLLLAMAEAGSISLAAALFWMGLFNVAGAYQWDLPMPVQPMKTVAAAAIADGLSSGETAAAGLFVGGAVLVLGATGGVEVVNRLVPRPVVSGIQLGLGIRMFGLALTMGTGSWTDADGPVAGGAFFLAAMALLRRKDRAFPVALLLVAAGLVLAAAAAAARGGAVAALSETWRAWRPGRLQLRPRAPSNRDWVRGIVRAGLPQLPLTTLNSVISVTALAARLFPEKDPPATRVGVATSVGVMNVVACWFGGAPACHGAGGLAGQYRFGARGGASVWVLGWGKVALALALGDALALRAVRAFPLSVLGALLAVAGVELAKAGAGADGAAPACIAAAAATVTMRNTGLGALVGLAVAWAEEFSDWCAARGELDSSEASEEETKEEACSGRV